MSYFDPTIYNDEALNEEERNLIAMYDLAMHDAGNKGFIIDDMLGFEDAVNMTTIEKIQREIAEQTIDAVIAYMESKRLETIVGLLDSRAEEDDDEENA